MRITNKQKWIISAICFAVTAVIATIYLFMITHGEDIDTDQYKTPESSPKQSTQETVPEKPPLPDNPIDFDQLQSENGDIYAWITMPGTKIDYPIVQSALDNNYYLRRNYLGKYSMTGCIFTQKLNSLDFSDPNTLIYGHYMRDGSFFGGLHNYRDPEYFENNKYFTIYIRGHILTYEVFAAYEYDNRHILYSFDFSDKAVFEEYLNTCITKDTIGKNVRDGVNLNGDSKIVTLSTCVQNSADNKRYLVQGVLIKDEETK